MSTTLTREPLLTSKSFIEGHNPEMRERVDARHQPLGYLYSEWDGVAPSPIFGHLDEETQTWDAPPGVITAGISTYTQTYCYSTDRCWDDSCA